MKKLLTVVLLSASLLLFSCGGQKNVGLSPVKGKTAVLFSSLAQVWIQAGGNVDITVGETVERGFASAETLLVDKGAGKTINTELLLSYEPSLVICSSDIPAQLSAAEILRSNGIKVLEMHIESFEDYLAALDAMTDITGNKTVYEDTVNSLGASIETLLESEEVKSAGGKKILFMRAGSTAASTKSKTSEEHFAADMLSDLGCINIADGSPLSQLGMESIMSEDPDFIFFSLMGEEEAARANVEELLASETWCELSAVMENRVFILPRELFHFKPCLRWGEAYKYLADILIGGK